MAFKKVFIPGVLDCQPVQNVSKSKMNLVEILAAEVSPPVAVAHTKEDESVAVKYPADWL